MLTIDHCAVGLEMNIRLSEEVEWEIVLNEIMLSIHFITVYIQLFYARRVLLSQQIC